MSSGLLNGILAIDPGSTQSAWVEYVKGMPVAWAKEDNEKVLAKCQRHPYQLCIESIASYGMAVGAEVFETCVWSGRFMQAWNNKLGSPITPTRVYRKDVKLHLCGLTRAKDTNVRQALIDRYGPGKEVAIGKKATPGPLYGMKSDCWAALAVAVTADETRLGVNQ